MRPLGVLTVDHEAPSRRALRAIVGATAGFIPLAEAASAEEALEIASELRPDLVLVELAMPGLDGLETSRRLTALVPDAVVLVMASNGTPGEVARAASGAAAFVSKQSLTPAVLHGLWGRYGPV